MHEDQATARSCAGCGTSVAPTWPNCPGCGAALSPVAAPPRQPPVEWGVPPGAGAWPGANAPLPASPPQTSPPPPPSWGSTPSGAWAPPPPGWGPPPAGAPAGGPPSQPSGRRSSTTVVVLAVIVVVVLVGGCIAWLVKERNVDDHPSAWPDELVDLVAFVERERRLQFAHPVEVHLVPAEEYSTRIAADGLDDEDREQLRTQVDVLRAFGLAEDDVDVDALARAMTDDATLAYYDPEDKEIVVRGTDLDGPTRAVVVHELVHALQDQHFDIGSTREDGFDTAGQSVAFSAVVEGDASRVERAYRERYSIGPSGDDGDDGDPAWVDKVPGALAALMSLPYAVGQEWTTVVAEVEGEAGVDAALRQPPASEEQVLFPSNWFDGDEPLEVEPLELPEGAELIEDTDFGVSSWLVMLGDRVDPIRVLRAADRWGGDHYITYRLDGVVCAQVRVVGDDDQATKEWSTLIDDWIATFPDRRVQRVADDRAVHIETCDPGSGTSAGGHDRFLDVVGIAAARMYFERIVVAAGWEVEDGEDYSWCVLEGLGTDLVIQVLGADGDDVPPATVRQVQRVQSDCEADLR